MTTMRISVWNGKRSFTTDARIVPFPRHALEVTIRRKLYQLREESMYRGLNHKYRWKDEGTRTWIRDERSAEERDRYSKVVLVAYFDPDEGRICYGRVYPDSRAMCGGLATKAGIRGTQTKTIEWFVNQGR